MNLRSLLMNKYIPVDSNFHWVQIPATIDITGKCYASGAKLDTISMTSVDVPGNTATKVLDKNMDRIGHFIISASPFYIGIDSSVTNVNGIYVPANTKFSLDNGNICYAGEVYVYSTSAIKVNVVEYIF